LYVDTDFFHCGIVLVEDVVHVFCIYQVTSKDCKKSQRNNLVSDIIETSSAGYCHTKVCVAEVLEQSDVKNAVY
jgi:hypothetical protein